MARRGLALPCVAGAAPFSLQAGYGRDNRHGVEKYEVSARWDANFSMGYLRYRF